MPNPPSSPNGSPACSSQRQCISAGWTSTTQQQQADRASAVPSVGRRRGADSPGLSHKRSPIDPHGRRREDPPAGLRPFNAGGPGSGSDRSPGVQRQALSDAGGCSNGRAQDTVLLPALPRTLGRRRRASLQHPAALSPPRERLLYALQDEEDAAHGVEGNIVRAVYPCALAEKCSRCQRRVVYCG